MKNPIIANQDFQMDVKSAIVSAYKLLKGASPYEFSHFTVPVKLESSDIYQVQFIEVEFESANIGRGRTWQKDWRPRKVAGMHVPVDLASELMLERWNS